MKNIGYLAALGRDMHENAVAKGWWGNNADADDTSTLDFRNVGEILMLVVTEVAEAMEDWRDGRSLAEINWTLKPKADGVSRWPGRDNAGIYLEEVHASTDGWDVGRRYLDLNLPDDRAFAESCGYEVKPHGFAIECADVIIRMLDSTTAWGIDIDAAVAVKMEYNRTRPHRHGGKRA